MPRGTLPLFRDFADLNADQYPKQVKHVMQPDLRYVRQARLRPAPVIMSRADRQRRTAYLMPNPPIHYRTDDRPWSFTTHRWHDTHEERPDTIKHAINVLAKKVRSESDFEQSRPESLAGPSTGAAAAAGSDGMLASWHDASDSPALITAGDWHGCDRIVEVGERLSEFLTKYRKTHAQQEWRPLYASQYDGGETELAPDDWSIPPLWAKQPRHTDRLEDHQLPPEVSPNIVWLYSCCIVWLYLVHCINYRNS
jgi:hypothetical protein